ncbi:MAG: thioredoxin-dependent thiol peroxidase [Acidimicrobiia bacterium]|jgi:peroxiredoxin Q/BCP|nr:thioredoxin-dependent thiol peroxidase [Acidimicrobiia bacterium]MBP8179651.1 thioredoxin-dependent thiol peroxidase [Acidimicrobiia bacterium]
MLEVGDKAPSTTLLDQNGDEVSIKDFRGHRVVLFFYPKANTPGCTTQSCNLRDAATDLATYDAVVIGVSPDKPTAQRRFDDKHALGFPLLSDPEHELAEAFGAWGEKKMFGKNYDGVIRSAFVIDDKGVISAAYRKISPKDTVPNVIAALDELGKV